MNLKVWFSLNKTMNVTVLYVGSSLLAPLMSAEQEINRLYKLDLRVNPHNFGSPLNEAQWERIESDLSQADVVFVIHVIDAENGARLISNLDRFRPIHHAVVIINCMPDLMRRTFMGRLDVATFSGEGSKRQQAGSSRALKFLATAGAWVGKQAKGHREEKPQRNHGHYIKLIDRLPGILKFVPTAGALTDAKHYLQLFCYFLQPTPANIESMLLYALKHYLPEEKLRGAKLRVKKPQSMPTVALYHPQAPGLFESFADYRKWYLSNKGIKQLDPQRTIGLLLMRPQVISGTTRHYDELILAIENEGLAVVPAIATLMDNRQAVSRFFVDSRNAKHGSKTSKQDLRVSQIVSLTGFSFVGGPAMNDSAAAARFLNDLNVPYRSAVSLDTQSVEAWQESQTGLNPIQAGMQIAIPEIDGATEPFVYGGIRAGGREPVGLPGRCERYARRLRRWNDLRTASRDQIRLAFTLFCFPPNKGNIGTAADLDVFPSLWNVLSQLERDGYRVAVPESPAALRESLLGGNSERFGAAANVIYRMTVAEYRRLCPFVSEIEREWGRAPGEVNSFAGDILIQGIQLENVFIGVQPTFGLEGDPMRLMMARSGSPHHGFMAFYTYVNKVLNADALVHVGTHGAMEFMPGKQVGLSDNCWPDRLIGEIPNFYLYSVNNPSEGSIAKRRSYAELISYLTPPIENAGLYKDLAQLKETLLMYRQSSDEVEKARLFESIESLSETLNFANATRRPQPDVVDQLNA